MGPDQRPVSLAIVARGLRSEPDPPRPGLEDVDVQCDLLVDTADQGSFLLDSINVLEAMNQLDEWLQIGCDSPFEYHSIDAGDHARILWFRPWRGDWAVGSPWADAGPFLVERGSLVQAVRRFIGETREAVEERWGEQVINRSS